VRGYGLAAEAMHRRAARAGRRRGGSACDMAGTVLAKVEAVLASVALVWVVLGFLYLYNSALCMSLPIAQYAVALLSVCLLHFVAPSLLVCCIRGGASINAPFGRRMQQLASAQGLPTPPMPVTDAEIDAAAPQETYRARDPALQRRLALSAPQEAPVCVVCMSELEDGDAIRILPCATHAPPGCGPAGSGPTQGHAFHRDCIDRWLKMQPSCPVCRCVVLAVPGHAPGHTLEPHFPAPAAAAAAAPSPPIIIRGNSLGSGSPLDPVFAGPGLGAAGPRSPDLVWQRELERDGVAPLSGVWMGAPPGQRAADPAAVRVVVPSSGSGEWTTGTPRYHLPLPLPAYQFADAQSPQRTQPPVLGLTQVPLAARSGGGISSTDYDAAMRSPPGMGVDPDHAARPTYSQVQGIGAGIAVGTGGSRWMSVAAAEPAS
jgi:hypothetical protein